MSGPVEPLLMTDAHRLIIGRAGDRWAIELAVIGGSAKGYLTHCQVLGYAAESSELASWIAQALPDPTWEPGQPLRSAAEEPEQSERSGD